MFAVPGWKISADSLATHGPDRVPAEAAAQETATVSASKTKKRKRDLPEEHLSGKDLDRLWNKHFGASDKTGAASKSSNIEAQDAKAHKKDKTRDAHTTIKEASAAVDETDELVVEENTEHLSKRQKQKQRQKRNRENSKSEQPIPPRAAAAKKSPVPENNDSNSSPKIQTNGNHASQSVPKALKQTAAVQAMLPPQPPPPPLSAALTPLQSKMRNKLTSARFRHLNQTLYTSTSSDAFQLFSASPELFAEYHAGFSQQVKDSWPQNPVDLYVRDIKERGILPEHGGRSEHGQSKLPLPRRKTGRCTIADLGCGDAPLARGCQSQVKALQLKFHNYDLHAPNSFVTKADIAQLPLRDGEADIAVFCLSLMGTNWLNFVEDAWRVLRGDGKGEVWVAEVKSRFGRTKPKVVENSVGNKKKKPKKDRTKPVGGGEDEKVNGEELFAEDDRLANQETDDTDISAFVDAFQRRGFILREGSVDRSNKMFIHMVLTKSGIPVAGKHQGMKWMGRGYEKMSGKSSGRMKFVDKDGEDDAIRSEDEGKLLKPTLYKTR